MPLDEAPRLGSMAHQHDYHHKAFNCNFGVIGVCDYLYGTRGGYDAWHARWEEELGVRQIWADEARAMTPEALAALTVSHLRERGLRRVYVSNDIDGTDARWAAACGTPEPEGLTREHVEAVLHGLEGQFDPIGADLVELAPGLSLDPALAQASVDTAVRYTRASIQLLGSSRE